MAQNEEPSTSDTETSASMSPTTRHFQIQLETDSPRPSSNYEEPLPRQLPPSQSGGLSQRDYDDAIARLQEVHEAVKAQRQRQRQRQQQEQSSSSISSSSTEKQGSTENSYQGHQRLTNAEWNGSDQHGPFFTAGYPNTAEDQAGSNVPPDRRLTNAEWNRSGEQGPFFTAEDQPGKNVTPIEPTSLAQSKGGVRDGEALRDEQISSDQKTSENQEDSQEEGK